MPISNPQKVLSIECYAISDLSIVAKQLVIIKYIFLDQIGLESFFPMNQTEPSQILATETVRQLTNMNGQIIRTSKYSAIEIEGQAKKHIMIQDGKNGNEAEGKRRQESWSEQYRLNMLPTHI